jgi:hypothetical protein
VQGVSIHTPLSYDPTIRSPRCCSEILSVRRVVVDRDTLVFVVVFFVTLFVEIVPGLASGVVLSWFLALTLPYSDVPPMHVLKSKSYMDSNAAASVEKDSVTLVDATHTGTDSTLRNALCLLEWQMALVFSNSAKLQVQPVS